MAELAIIVPTRGRPGNVEKVIGAWDATNAWDVADLILAVDADDPEIDGYMSIKDEFYQAFNNESAPYSEPLQVVVRDAWQPMVHKLDTVAVALATGRTYWALGFAGDDHLPRTINWARAYLAALHDLGTGLVYGDDGYQHENLCTEWAMTADAVRALGRMVPAPVEHMYSDVSVLDVFRGAGAVRYLPQVVIEHMHPIVGKAENDAQYRKVNHRDQFRKDRETYDRWTETQRDQDIAAVAALQPDREVPPVAPEPRARRSRRTYPEPAKAAWGTGRLIRSNQPARSGPSVKKGPTVQFPRSSRRLTPQHLRDVQALTPPEVGITLADFARQVPADKAIVELGVHHGYTLLMMAWGAREGLGAHVWGFDPWDLPNNVYEGMWDLRSARLWAQHNVRAKGYGKAVTLTQLPSQDAASLWEGPPVALLHVDGAHEYDAARGDLLAWLAHLAPDAVIAVDDYNEGYREHVVKAVDELVAEGVLAPIELFHGRLAVTRVATEPPPVVVQHEANLHGGIPMQTVSLPDSEDPGALEHTAAGPVHHPVYPVTQQDNGTVMVENEPPSNGPPAAEELELIENQRMVVLSGELEGVHVGTEVESLAIPQLKALAKKRGIVLGYRKDKRQAIIDAIRAGK